MACHHEEQALWVETETKKMDWDEPKAAQTAAGQHTVGEPLDKLSKTELETRVQALENEIARLKSELDRKKAHEAAAAELFTGKS